MSLVVGMATKPVHLNAWFRLHRASVIKYLLPIADTPDQLGLQPILRVKLLGT